MINMRTIINAAGLLYEAVALPPAFWQWFGKSMVVDANGNPLVLYHGTDTNIAIFKGMIWGTVEPELANDYALMRSAMNNKQRGDVGTNVMPFYMRIERSFDADLGVSKTVTVGSFFNSVMEQATANGVDVLGQRNEIINLLNIVHEARRREESGPHYSRHDFWNNTTAMFGDDGAAAIQKLFQVLGFDGIKMIEDGDLTFGAFHSNQVKSVFNKAFTGSENISEDMTEDTLPTTARELVQRYGGRSIPFGKLPKLARLAIRTRAKEHLDPDEKAPRIDPNMLFGYVEIPMDALKHAILAAIQRENPDAPFNHFDEYHQWYTSHGDTPNHKEVWPIELDMVADNEIIDDGSHRLHSYIRSGLTMVPAIYQLD